MKNCPFCQRKGQKLIARGGISVSLVAPPTLYGCEYCQISFRSAEAWNARASDDGHFTSWLLSFGDTPRSPRSLAQLWESRSE